MPFLYPNRPCRTHCSWVLPTAFALWASLAAVGVSARLVTRPIYPFNGLLDAVMTPISRAWSVGLAAGVLTARTMPQAPLSGDVIQTDIDAATPLDAGFSPLVGVRIRWRF